ncbi:TPA: hypothetical protein HA265_02780 [Candidatus Woesearchaeota archaeon]|nr:hypothetical protein [Candidatus Woesearchaeota archaeon]
MIRYIAEFLDLQYTELKKSREVVLTHILLGPSFIKDEGSLFTLVNSSRWFLVDRIIEDEKKIYESRMKDKEATKIYPSDPSGYKKAQRYDEWELMNHTSKDDLVMDKVEKLDNGLVLTTYAGMTTYRLTYRFTTSEERSENIILYDTKEVTETKLNFVNTISFSCSPETVVTVYDYSYDSQFPIDRENLRLQADAMKYRLINTAKRLQQSCSAKYRTKMFLADGDAAIR